MHNAGRGKLTLDPGYQAILLVLLTAGNGKQPGWFVDHDQPLILVKKIETGILRGKVVERTRNH
jgi:hypothetical protein